MGNWASALYTHIFEVVDVRVGVVEVVKLLVHVSGARNTLESARKKHNTANFIDRLLLPT